MEAEAATVAPEAPAVFKHAQHTRLLKAVDDETWISSEDLNTEESSEDEASRRKFKKKNRRHSRTKSASQLAKLIKPGLPAERTSCKNERAVLAEISKRTPETTDCSPPHETWKPQRGRGSLKFEDLDEALGAIASSSGTQSAEMQKMDLFYTEMMYNVKHLKNTNTLPALNTNKSPVSCHKNNTFAALKNTPEVQEKLAFIEKFERDIQDTIEEYKQERAKRLETEKEMRKVLSETKIPLEKGTEYFLKLLCEHDYEDSDDDINTSSKKFNLNTIFESTETSEIDQNENRKNEEKSTSFQNKKDFIARNKKLAKEAASGVMAQFWLTDEEKIIQKQLLADEEEEPREFTPMNFEIPTPTSSLHLSDEEENSESENDNEVEEPQNTNNAFSFNRDDRIRLDQINSELEKFVDDESERETSKIIEETETENKFWKKFNSEQALKEINANLEKLHQSFIEDEAKLKEISAQKQCVT